MALFSIKGIKMGQKLLQIGDQVRWQMVQSVWPKDAKTAKTCCQRSESVDKTSKKSVPAFCSKLCKLLLFLLPCRRWVSENHHHSCCTHHYELCKELSTIQIQQATFWDIHSAQCQYHNNDLKLLLHDQCRAHSDITQRHQQNANWKLLDKNIPKYPSFIFLPLTVTP